MVNTQRKHIVCDYLNSFVGNFWFPPCFCGFCNQLNLEWNLIWLSAFLLMSMKKLNVDFSSNKISFVKNKNIEWKEHGVLWQSAFNEDLTKDIFTAKKNMRTSRQLKDTVEKHFMVYILECWNIHPAFQVSCCQHSNHNIIIHLILELWRRAKRRVRQMSGLLVVLTWSCSVSVKPTKTKMTSTTFTCMVTLPVSTGWAQTSTSWPPRKKAV